MEIKTTVTKLLSVFVSAGIIFSFSACGRKTGSDVVGGHQAFEQQPNRGIYRARLKILNGKVGFRHHYLVNARARISVLGDRVHRRRDTHH